MSSRLKTSLSVEEINRNFTEIEPRLTAAEAAFESSRCLYCYDAPCTVACPTHIDVPGFIKKIGTGNLRGASRVILDSNPLGSTCSRVCPVEVLCEGACVEKTLLKQPIQIGRLQRFAVDYALDGQIDVLKAGESNGRSVGIVGSGPAGLACATYLRRLGYAVTVYDRRPLAGGLATYGMAEYKMTQQHSLDEVAMIERLGVSFMLNTEIGRDLGIEDLETSHDAIFLAVGLGATNELGIPGENLEGVYDALDFIQHVKSRDWLNVPIGTTVAVIGAGNTSIDAVTQARRLGAEHVYLIYRRRQSDMSAFDFEYELAKQSAVEFKWRTLPTAILPAPFTNHVGSLRCKRTEVGGPDATGRRSLVAVEGSEFEIHVDMVIKATGQDKLREFLTLISGVVVEKDGRVIVDPATMQTGNPRYFAGGDCVNGGAEVVDAAQQGKHAAIGIHKMLTGQSISFAGSGV